MKDLLRMGVSFLSGVAALVTIKMLDMPAIITAGAVVVVVAFMVWHLAPSK